MGNIAFVYADLGRHQDEFIMHEEALQFRRKNLPPSHPDVARAMHNFVPCLNSAGEHIRAFDLQCQALHMLAESLPKTHPHLLSAQRQLSATTDQLVGMYEKSERHEEVRASLHKALERLTTVPDCTEHNTNIGVLMCKLSGAYLAMGQYQNAAVWQEKGIQMHRQELTEENAITCGAMGNLAVIYSKLCRHQDAMFLREKVLHISRRVLPKDHPDIGIAINNFARSLQDLGRHHEALPLLEQNLEFHKRVLPHNHPEIAASMNNLAMTLEAIHRNADALKLYEQALEFRCRVLPGHHVHIGQSMMNISSALCKASRFTDALAMSSKALAFFRRNLPPDHPETGGCVWQRHVPAALIARVLLVQHLRVVNARIPPGNDGTHFTHFAGGALDAHAFVQFNCNQFHDSVATLKEALGLYRRSLPSNHPKILRTISNIDSAFGHIVSHHADAGDHSAALVAASNLLQFLKENLQPNDVTVSPRLWILAKPLCVDELAGAGATGEVSSRSDQTMPGKSQFKTEESLEVHSLERQAWLRGVAEVSYFRQHSGPFSLVGHCMCS